MKITGLSINCMEYQQDFWMSSASANQIYNKRFCILVRIGAVDKVSQQPSRYVIMRKTT